MLLMLNPVILPSSVVLDVISTGLWETPDVLRYSSTARIHKVRWDAAVSGSDRRRIVRLFASVATIAASRQPNSAVDIDIVSEVIPAVAPAEVATDFKCP
jgi:hypothetical protein